jgi:hypothetical protein
VGIFFNSTDPLPAAHLREYAGSGRGGYLSCEGIARALEHSLDREILSPVRKHPEAGSFDDPRSLKSVCSLIGALVADFPLNVVFNFSGKLPSSLTCSIQAMIPVFYESIPLLAGGEQPVKELVRSRYLF